ncbi:MAG TPA: hypothetical protein VGI11_17140 [Variovorax sp.]|jgi:hypothetical protein
MLKIEKFVAGRHVSTTRVPNLLACRVLPESAHAGLAVQGIHLREIAAARKDGIAYSKVVSVTEGGVAKRVRISSP